MMRIDQRGAPDYSHYDYAAEGARMYEQGKRDGATDKAAGKEPNHYLYVVASSTYSHAKGYREGYGVPAHPELPLMADVGSYDDWFVEEE